MVSICRIVSSRPEIDSSRPRIVSPFAFFIWWFISSSQFVSSFPNFKLSSHTLFQLSRVTNSSRCAIDSSHTNRFQISSRRVSCRFDAATLVRSSRRLERQQKHCADVVSYVRSVDSSSRAPSSSCRLVFDPPHVAWYQFFENGDFFLQFSK